MRVRVFIGRLPVGWTGRFVLLRLASKWRSMLTAIAGVLLVAIIGASSPLYTAAITQVGMVQRLAQQPPEDVHILSRVSLAASQTDNLDAAWAADDVALEDQVHQVLETELPGWVAQVVMFANTTWMRVVRDGQDLDARMSVAYYDHWMQAVQVVEGEWPQDPPRAGVDLEAALGSGAAARLDLKVNDEIVLDQRGWESSVPVRVRITAIVRDAPNIEPYLNAPAPLRIGASNQARLETNLLTPRSGFLRIATRYVPDAGSILGWWVLFDHTHLSYTDTERALSSLERFAALSPATFSSGSNFIYRTNLPLVLQEYERGTNLASTPFEVLLLQISALALFFLMTNAALIRRGERRETAVLQTRGAFNRQILILRGLEALVICTVATLAAPFLARQFLEWIFPALTGLEQIPLQLNDRVFAYAAFAAGVACLVLMATLYPILRLPLVSAGGSTVRSEKQLWWQRYYLDLAFLLVGVVALLRLTDQSSLSSASQQGNYTTDMLLLLSPALLFVAMGSLILRLFPGVIGLLARILARRLRLESTLATWQVSREPAHYGRITFLLALAISTGWMATSFQATLSQNHIDRAAYSIGADLRLEEHDVQLRTSRVHAPDFYTQIEGVISATTATRIFRTNISNDLYESTAGIILAVQPGTLVDTTYWRDDLGELKLPPLPDRMTTLPVVGRALPVIPGRVALSVRLEVGELTDAGMSEYRAYPDFFWNRIQLSLRLRDESGALITVPLQPVEQLPAQDGWVYVEGDLQEALSAYIPKGELSLDAFYWVFSVPLANRRTNNVFALSFDNLTLTMPDDSLLKLDWFTTEDRWDIIHGSGDGIEGTVRASSNVGVSGAIYRQVSWSQNIQTGIVTMGMLLNYPEVGPIPAIGSSAFASLNGLIPGTIFQIRQIKTGDPWFQLADTTDYFPTLYPDQRAFVIVNQDALLYTLNRLPDANIYPTEAWLRLESGASTESTLDLLKQHSDDFTLKNVRTFDQALNDLQSDILFSIGLSGMLYLAFGVALILSVLSLLTYAALTTQMRRIEFGVLQALGFSSFRVIVTMLLEQILVIVIGIGQGVILGIVVSERLLPTMALSVNGQLITPPFVIHAGFTTLLQYVFVMLLVLAFILAATMMMIRQMSLAQSLRFGEE